MSDDASPEPEILAPLKKRGRPKGLPKTGGRKPGVKNRVTPDLRKMIIERGKPIELLCDISRGVKIRVGPQAGPGDPQYQYPTLQERASAAKLLLDKLVPAAPVDALPEGKPIETADATEMSDIDLARRIAFQLDLAVHKKIPAGQPKPITLAGTQAVLNDQPWMDLPEEIEAREKKGLEWRDLAWRPRSAAETAAALRQSDPVTAESASAAMSARWAGPDPTSQEALDLHLTRASDAAFQKMNAPQAITSRRFRNRT